MPALTSSGGRSTPVVCLVCLSLASVVAPPVTGAEEVDCSAAKVHCVDDSVSPMQEFSTIQAAVDKARKGHTVVVAPGDYAGFRVSRSGKKKRPIVIRGQPGARIIAPEGDSDTGIYLSRASWVTVEGFEVDGTAGSLYQGIAARDATATQPMKGVIIRANTVHGAELTNIYLSNAADSLIEDNVARDSLGSHGIYVANGGADGVVVRGNEASGNAKNGIHFNGDASVGGDGLHQGATIEGNRFSDNGANGLDLDGVAESTLRNNLVAGNGRHGLRAFAIDAAAGPADLVIVNNTFVDNGGWAVKLSEDDGGHVVFNNILLSDDGALAVGHDDLQSDFNVVRGRFSLDSEATTLTLSQWRRAGHDASSVKSSRGKLFKKPGKGDYHLKGSSPAVDAGAAQVAGVSAPTSDLEGALRPAGAAHDVGAYERGGATSS